MQLLGIFFLLLFLILIFFLLLPASNKQCHVKLLVTVFFPWSQTRFTLGACEFLSWTSGPKDIGDREASGLKWKELWKLGGASWLTATSCSRLQPYESHSFRVTAAKMFSTWCQQLKIALLSLQRRLASRYWGARCHPWSLTPLDFSGWTC